MRRPEAVWRGLVARVVVHVLICAGLAAAPVLVAAGSAVADTASST
jgi:hypothetical protein